MVCTFCTRQRNRIIGTEGRWRALVGRARGGFVGGCSVGVPGAESMNVTIVRGKFVRDGGRDEILAARPQNERQHGDAKERGEQTQASTPLGCHRRAPGPVLVNCHGAMVNL